MDMGDPATVFLWMGNGSCSGTLVSPKTVLTAKHCIEGVTPGDMSVFFGSDSNGNGTWIQTTRLLGHTTGDIAMIAMQQAAPSSVMWIPINEQALGSAQMGQEVRIVGFGVTGETHTDSGLKRVGMTELYQLDDDIMYVGNAGSKTCYGDSGGPAFMSFGGQEHVAGVTSFGTDVCEQGLSGEVRVDLYADWIKTFIQDNDPATCGADTRCAANCASPDPDCGPDGTPTDPGTDNDPTGGDDGTGTGPGGGGGGGVEDEDPMYVGGISGGCAVGGAHGSDLGLGWLLALGLAAAIRRRRW